MADIAATIDSVLLSTKKLLGIDSEDTNFDTDIIIHINSVFMVLNQLGVGPSSTFSITGNDETWTDFIAGKTNLSGVRTYVYMKVRLVFDPPSTAAFVSSWTNVTMEYENRLSLENETEEYDVRIAAEALAAEQEDGE